MSLDVYVVATGARTPVGLCSETTAAATRAGLCRIREHPRFVGAGGELLRCARDGVLGVDVPGVQRLVEMALSSLREVAADIPQAVAESQPVPLFLGLPSPRPGFDDRTAELVVQGIEAVELPHGARVIVEPLRGDHTAAFRALDIGIASIAQGTTSLCIVGGVDSYLDIETLDWLDSQSRLAREGVRGGFIPGEGAGMLLLAERTACLHYGLARLARVRGVATVAEPRSLGSPEGVLGEGLTSALRRALGHLSVPEERIDDVYCDINGERYRSDEWGFTVLRLQRRLRGGARYRSGVASSGDVGAASGAVNCVLATQAWKRRYARGPRTVVWGSSYEGERGAAVLEQVTSHETTNER